MNKKGGKYTVRTLFRKGSSKRGIRIKAVGLTEKERKIIEEAMRKIKYGRKKGNCPSLPYLMELK